MKDLLTNRRGWAAILAAANVISTAAGYPISEVVGNEAVGLVVDAVSGLLAAWSLYFPKAI